ncbi:MAG: AAA family ATPase [Actinomycetota bacterium]
MTCLTCGEQLPEDARFCPNCGAPVGEPATEERKLVTVLFADLAASTDLAIHLDAERFREVMQAFYQMVSRELSSLRGRAEKFVGDAVMAVFGLPHAHEDDALRAVRAGLMIRDRTERLSETLGLPVALGVRVGIASGGVAIGPSGPGEPFVVGATVNLAARLQQAAATGEVLVSETTRQLSATSVTFGSSREVEAKGFGAGLMAHPVTGLGPRSGRRTIPLVGRDRELSLLADAFRRARETRRAHQFTVLGEPGIGKSRLADEFVSSLEDDVTVLIGQAGRFDEETALAPIAEMIRREIGVERETPTDVVAKRLHDVVEGCCDPTETEKTAARLGLVLGLGEESRDNRPYRIAEVRAGFIALLEGRARSGPVVLVFEDLHLARAGLLELVEQTVRHARRIPLFVLALAREELLEAATSWGGGIPDAVTLRLEPLSRDDALDLALAAGESIDRPTAERIAFAAGGNPFFIVEATGIQRSEHSWDAAPHGHPVPPTVEAVIASRIDHLPGEAREVLRKASVFARSTFHETQLEVIAERDGRVLGVLEQEELLVRDHDRPGVWRFRHEMVRDVAYGSLTKRDRLRLHMTLADRLLEGGNGRDLQTAAYHLEQAAHASLDLIPDDRTLADRAVEGLSKAGDRARRGIESRSAIDLYERALALAGPEERWGSREAWILSGLGEARYWLGEFEPAAASLSRALDLQAEDLWIVAHAARFLGDVELSVRGNRERARELFDRALAASRELADPWVLARTLLMAGWEPYWREDMESATAAFREAHELARANPEGDKWAEARALTFLAAMSSGAADEPEVIRLGEEALAVARELDDPFTIAVAEERVGTSRRKMLELDTAFARIDDAVRILEDLGARWEYASVLGERGHIRKLQGRHDDAVRDLRSSLAVVRELNDRVLVAWVVKELFHALLEAGDREGARKLFAECETELEAEEPGSRSIPLQMAAVAALLDGDRDVALEKSLEVLELERSRAWPLVTADQTWFVGRVFGADAVGGEAELEAARRRLEQAQWRQALQEPDRILQAVASP